MSYLLFHPESDCLWRVDTQEEVYSIIASEPLVVDVTGLQEFEDKWQRETISVFRGEYEFLSNFYGCKVVFEGVCYHSAEHAYQAAKSTSPEVRAKVAAIDYPGDAKKLGRRIQLRPDWEDIKLEVMEEILFYKFAAPALRAKLLNTGNKELIEGNTWGDTFWGVCGGKGQNHLGKLLMKIRERYTQGF
jgi:ribA/ribD-fused uncharacterized protein